MVICTIDAHSCGRKIEKFDPAERFMLQCQPFWTEVKADTQSKRLNIYEIVTYHSTGN